MNLVLTMAVNFQMHTLLEIIYTKLAKVAHLAIYPQQGHLAKFSGDDVTRLMSDEIFIVKSQGHAFHILIVVNLITSYCIADHAHDFQSWI